MGKWSKGQSGNPGGRPREIGELRALARERTVEALETLTEIMADEKAPPAARVSAACAILDRGFGRPAQAVALTNSDGVALNDEAEIDRRIAELEEKLASPSRKHTRILPIPTPPGKAVD